MVQAQGDRLFRSIGRYILISYACYLPVVLWVQRAPMLGMHSARELGGALDPAYYVAALRAFLTPA